MIINHNITAMNTYRQLSINEKNMQNSMAHLSSGLRINSAADDAAGLAISEKMKSQMRGLEQASRNAQDGISLVQTAEGALSQTTDILQRMRELATQASSDTATDSDRTQMQKEVSQLKSEVDRISGTTQFNTKNLLDGSLSAATTAQGTDENSNSVKAAMIAATSGTTTGGAGLVQRAAVAAVAGTAATTTGGTSVASSITVDATHNSFKVTVNGGAASADISIAQGTYDQAGFLNAINNALTTYNTGKTLDQQVVASYTNNNNLVFSTKTTGAGTSISVSAGAANDATSTIMGFATQNGAGGTDSVNAVNSGVTNIIAGANDQFKLQVDGGSAQTLTLTAGSYNSATDLVNEVNKQIQGNLALNGKVTASLDQNNKIIFTSTSTGTSSNVVVSDPTTTNESALSALGYGGSATTLTATGAGTIDNTDGNSVDLSSASKASFDLTIGNTTHTINLSSYAGIDAKSTRDSIVNAMQSEINKQFGAGAVTVSVNGSSIKLTNNSGSAVFSVANGANTGATQLFGGGATATVGSYAGTTSVTGSNATGGVLANTTKLSDLTDTDGNSLNLQAGNVIKLSGTQNGDGFSTQLTVGANTTVADLINQMKTVPALANATITFDTTKGQIDIQGQAGFKNDISNLSLSAQNSATDTTAVGKFNSTFASFNVTQQAQDAHSDNSLTLAIGANQGQTMKIDINDMSTKGLKIQDIDVTTQAGAQTAMSVLDNAINSVSSERAKLGAYQNRLNYTINNLNTSDQNLTTAQSGIADVDMAKEMMSQTKNSVLAQAAQAMLAQANQQPQQVLQLLR